MTRQSKSRRSTRKKRSETLTAHNDVIFFTNYVTRYYPEKQTPLLASGRQRLASSDLQIGRFSQELFFCAI